MEKVLERVKSFKIPSPEETFEKFGKWFDTNKKMALIIAVVVAFITNVVLLSTMIMSPDGLWNSIRYSAGQVETESGRWAVDWMDSLRKNIAMPTVTTIYSIIITGFVAMFMVDFFEFKSKFSIVCTSAFLGVSPCLAVTLLYSYTADCYTWAFLFAVLAAWFIYNEKHKILGPVMGAIATMFVLALYQNYLGVIIGLCILKPLFNVLKGEKDYKEIFTKIGISILVVGIGLGLYYTSEQIALDHYNTSLSSYGGANDVGLLNTLKNLNKTIPSTYGRFISFFIGNDILVNTNMSRNVFYKILFVSCGVAYLYVLTTRKAKDSKTKLIDTALVLAMTAILPIGLNIIILIAPNTMFYTLNSAQMLLIIPFFMKILEFYEKDKGAIIKWISFSMCFLIVFTYYLAANATFFWVKIRYNQAYSTTIRAVERIESMEGYTKGMPWMFAGILDQDNTDIVSDLQFLTLGGMANGPIFHGNYSGALSTWTKFLNQFMGIQPNFCSKDDYFRIVGSDEFKEMTIFPNEGSVKEIDGVIVVRFSQTPPVD